MADRILVTGGAGFLGWHFCGRVLATRPSGSIRILDAFTYAGSRRGVEWLESRWAGRLEVLEGDVADAVAVAGALKGVEAVVHLAAETHVDRSIRRAAPFVRTNVLGTQTLIDAVRHAGTPRFLHVSTDEVYGHRPLGSELEGPFSEDSPLRPRSPYAGSKAAADHLVQASIVTHGLPAIVVRPCNLWGEAQYPEKLIPVAIRCGVEGRPVPIYGQGTQVREWVHASDMAEGLLSALERGREGAVYNLGGGQGMTNLELVRLVLGATGASAELIEFVSDRPGHDERYGMDTRLAETELDWRPAVRLEDRLGEVVDWYRGDGAEWWG